MHHIQTAFRANCPLKLMNNPGLEAETFRPVATQGRPLMPHNLHLRGLRKIAAYRGKINPSVQSPATRS